MKALTKRNQHSSLNDIYATYKGLRFKYRISLTGIKIVVERKEERRFIRK
jgi:hypothetical protein